VKKPKTSSTGVLLLDKPKGVSSHDAIKVVRRAFGQREVGHTGTLDPMATGLMVVMLGRATRVARFVEAQDKTYVGTVTLGRGTTTWDAEGEVTELSSVPELDARWVERALSSLVGEIRQQVPIYSAVKVGGERLYQKARRGDAIETPVRTVVVHELKATRIDLPEIDIVVRCSKGTYIRSLAVQIGRALELPAHLSMLRRTRVGPYDVADAVQPDALQGTPDELRTLLSAVEHLPVLEVDDRAADDVRHGRPLSVATVGPLLRRAELPIGAPMAVVQGGELLAVAESKLASADLAGAEPSDRAVGYACVLVGR
jgi:tRNA pseudouridine55 synthase